jgi:uncharacterized protein (DUF486 family)
LPFRRDAYATQFTYAAKTLYSRPNNAHGAAVGPRSRLVSFHIFRHKFPMLITILLLIVSNAFMTIAWYGHLKFENTALWKVILISWLIAFFEYCFQVPANRWGNLHGLSPTQLKIIQEGITLTVFIVFAKLYFTGEPFKWNYAVGFVLMFAAVFVVNYQWSK